MKKSADTTDTNIRNLRETHTSILFANPVAETTQKQDSAKYKHFPWNILFL